MNIVYGQQGIMFSKGKGLLGMSSRPRRRTCKVSLNYDDNHLWEDDAVYVGENQQGDKTHKFLSSGGSKKTLILSLLRPSCLGLHRTHKKHMRNYRENSSLLSGFKDLKVAKTARKVRHPLSLLFADLLRGVNALSCL